MDPPRPEVSGAVDRCYTAGIRIIMITGDYGLTAESIARRIGIVRGPQPRIITGSELNGMDEETLRLALQEEVIFARVAPEDKLRVVTALMDMGEVVAVTGDGVNDAPALKKADIGVAMGITGTDVAKEAADMILTNDNFASIVSAVEEGRAVFSNIRKFAMYVFNSNMAEAVPFVVFLLLGRAHPPAADGRPGAVHRPGYRYGSGNWAGRRAARGGYHEPAAALSTRAAVEPAHPGSGAVLVWYY